MATIPTKSMTSDQLRTLQAQRAKSSGIEALNGRGEHLTFPKGWPENFDFVADIPNIGFRMDTESYARTARGRFKQNADRYDLEKSKRIVHTRIVERMLALRMAVSIDEGDPLDMLLPAALRKRAQNSVKRMLDRAFRLDLTIARAEQNAQGEFEVEAIVASDTPIRDGDGKVRVLEASALKEIADWLTRKYRSVFRHHVHTDEIGAMQRAWVEGAKPALLHAVYIVSKARPDIRTKIEERTLSQHSIMAAPYGDIRREYDKESGEYIYYVPRAIGYEASIVGIGADPTNELLSAHVQRSLEPGQHVVAFEASIALDAAGRGGPAGEEAVYMGSLSLGTLPSAAVTDLAQSLQGAFVLREAKEVGTGAVTAAWTKEGKIGVVVRAEACAPEEAAQYHSLVLRGLACVGEDGEVASLATEYAKLSTEPAPIGTLQEIIVAELNEPTPEPVSDAVPAPVVDPPKVEPVAAAPAPEPAKVPEPATAPVAQAPAPAAEKPVERSSQDRALAYAWGLLADLDFLINSDWSDIPPELKAKLLPPLGALRDALTPAGVPVEPVERASILRDAVTRAAESATARVAEVERALFARFDESKKALDEQVAVFERRFVEADTACKALDERIKLIERAPAGGAPGARPDPPPPEQPKPTQPFRDPRINSDSAFRKDPPKE